MGSAPLAAGHASGEGSLGRALIWALALLFGALVWAHRWVCDDGFIYFHVADNLLSGFGPVFNPGERIEAYTSPVWLGLIAAFGAIFKLLSPRGLPSFEWISVGLGVTCSIGAYLAASVGADRLWGKNAPAVPVGGLFVLGLVPFWDYGTSGLESSLVLLWLGLSFAAAVHLQAASTKASALATAICVGLGPLVRPDLGIFSLLWGLAILAGTSGWPRRLELAAAAGLLPLGYELFRMGYFACLVPNTAIAKEASVAAWRRGWLYFVDFETTYQLWIPILLLAGAIAWAWARFSKRDSRPALLTAATVLGGVLHALYIIRVGGDFLHARMLLPSLFALALPVFTLPMDRGAWVLAPALAAWAIGGLAFVPVRSNLQGIDLERGRLDYIALTGHEHPVTEGDHRGMHWDRAAELLDEVRAIPGAGTGVAWFYGQSTDPAFHWAVLRSWVAPTIEGVAAVGAVGMFGYGARQRIYVCDRYGLADPYGARLEMPVSAGDTGRGKVGHEKYAGDDWCLGHLVEALDGHARYSPSAGFVKSALVCGDLAELQAAVDEPLSWRRFWRNVRWSRRLTQLRIPRIPLDARGRFCGEHLE